MTVIEIDPGNMDVVEVEVSQDTVEITSSGQPGPPGPTGPQGPPGAATTPVIIIGQADYDALTPPDPDTLYVILGP